MCNQGPGNLAALTMSLMIYAFWQFLLWMPYAMSNTGLCVFLESESKKTASWF